VTRAQQVLGDNESKIADIATNTLIQTVVKELPHQTGSGPFRPTGRSTSRSRDRS
jgi:hypothetical protein